MTTGQTETDGPGNAAPDVSREVRTIAKGSAIGIGGKISAGLLAIVVMPIVVRILGADNFGVYTLANRLLEILALFVHFGFITSIARFVGIHEGEGRPDRSGGVILGTAAMTLGASFLLSALIFLNPQWISVGFFHKAGFTPVVRMVIFALPLLVLTMLLLQATIAKGTMFFRTVSDVVVDPVKLACIFIFCRVMGMGITGAVIAIFALNISRFSVAAIGIRSCFPGIKPSHIRNFRAWTVMSYSFPLVLAELSAFSIFQINSLVGARWLLNRDIGIYGAVFSIVTIGAAGYGVIASIFMPVLADLHNRKQKEKLKILYRTATRWAYHLSIMPLVFLAIKSKAVLMIFGAEFTSGAAAMTILSSSLIINAITGYGAEMLIMSNRPWLPTVNNFVMGTANVALSFILVPVHGITGLAVAAAVGMSGSNILACVEAWIIHGLHPFTKKACKPAAAALFAAPVLLVHISPWWLELAATGIMYVCVYSVVAVLIKLEEEDREIVGAVLEKLRGGGNRKD